MNRIRLSRESRERVFLALDANPPFGAGVTVEVQVNETGTWYPASNTVVSGRRVTAEVLVAGPDADATGAVPVLVDSTLRVRLTDFPEQFVRGGAYIVIAD